MNYLTFRGMNGRRCAGTVRPFPVAGERRVEPLRLEYYELFSRVFETEGRPYSPWRVPIDRAASADPASHVKSPDLLLKGDAS